MGCAMGIVKYLVFLFNLVFAIAGGALIVIGVLAKLNYTDAIDGGDSSIELAPIFTIVVGCIIFVIAFFGCCGAIRESTCMLTTYAVILLIFFILQIAIGVYAFLEIKDNKELNNEVNKGLDKLFSKLPDKEAAAFFNDIQLALSCCGVNTYKDYSNKNLPLPSSCCGQSEGSCSEGSHNLHFNGCSRSFAEKVQASVKNIAIVVFVIAAIEILGAIFALCLNSSIRNYSRRGAYA